MSDSIIKGRWLTLDEAASYLRKSPKTLYNLKNCGKLKGYNSGNSKRGKLLFQLCDLDQYIMKGKGD